MNYVLIVLLASMALVSSALGEGNTVSVGNDVNPGLHSGNIEMVISVSNEDLLTGDGNTLNQLNQKDSNNYGTGPIIQNQNFHLLVTGDNNFLSQTNYALAENWGWNSLIEQTQNDFAVIVGNGNYLEQINRAIARNYGAGNVVSQTQNNSEILAGNGNNLYQENDASTSVNGNDNSIDQDQSNDAVQTGDCNSLRQINNLMGINYESGANSGYDSYGNYYYNPWSSEVLIDGAYVSGYKNQITQTQGNTAMQVGFNNNLEQENDAIAAIEEGNNDVVSQEQSNTAAQSGNDSAAMQTNSLINRDIVDYQSSNGSWSQQSRHDGAVPGALMRGQNNNINQAQKNSLLETGTADGANQENRAYGQMVDSATFSNSISQDQNNTVAQTGDNNGASQLNNLVRREYRYESGDNWEVQSDYPVPGAQVSSGNNYASYDNVIFQTQGNIAAQIGNSGNMVDQTNDAVADHSNPDYGAQNSRIDQTQSNEALEVGDNETGISADYRNMTHLSQGNLAGTHNSGRDNHVNQTESNLAAITGVGERAGSPHNYSIYDAGKYIYYEQGQFNSQYANPDPASLDGQSGGIDRIDQNAANDLVMLGSYDLAGQSNDQNANQNYESDTYLNQNASNKNIVTGTSVDWLPCV